MGYGGSTYLTSEQCVQRALQYPAPVPAPVTLTRVLSVCPNPSDHWAVCERLVINMRVRCPIILYIWLWVSR